MPRRPVRRAPKSLLLPKSRPQPPPKSRPVRQGRLRPRKSLLPPKSRTHRRKNPQWPRKSRKHPFASRRRLPNSRRKSLQRRPESLLPMQRLQQSPPASPRRLKHSLPFRHRRPPRSPKPRPWKSRWPSRRFPKPRRSRSLPQNHRCQPGSRMRLQAASLPTPPKSPAPLPPAMRARHHPLELRQPPLHRRANSRQHRAGSGRRAPLRPANSVRPVLQNLLRDNRARLQHRVSRRSLASRRPPVSVQPPANRRHRPSLRLRGNQPLPASRQCLTPAVGRVRRQHRRR